MNVKQPRILSKTEIENTLSALGCPEEQIKATLRDFRIIVPTLFSTETFVNGERVLLAQAKELGQTLPGNPHLWTIYLYLWHSLLMFRFRGRKAGFSTFHPLDEIAVFLLVETNLREIRLLQTRNDGNASAYLGEVRAEQSLLIHYLKKVWDIKGKYPDYLRSDVPLSEIDALKTNIENAIARTEKELQRARENRQPFDRTNDVDILEDEIVIHNQLLKRIKLLWGSPTAPRRTAKPFRMVYPAVFDQHQMTQFISDLGPMMSAQIPGVVRWYRYMLPALCIHFGEEEILRLMELRKQAHLLPDHASSWKNSARWMVAWAKHIVETERENLQLITSEIKPRVVTIEAVVNGKVISSWTITLKN